MERQKLKNLFALWPANALATSAWLEKQGVSRQLIRKYRQNGWVEGIGNGAYARKGDRPSWQGGIFALQQGLELKIHVGGLSALALLDGSHFVSRGKMHVNLFNSNERHPRRLLPKWLITRFAHECLFYYHRYSLFDQAVGLRPYTYGNFEIIIASRERALMEVLSLVPKKMSFEHAALLFQGKETLRPDLIQTLLEACLSQQTNRLFIHLAKKNHYAFLNALNLKTINFGEGKRVVGTGKVFDEALNLYVPELNPGKDEMIGL